MRASSWIDSSAPTGSARTTRAARARRCRLARRLTRRSRRDAVVDDDHRLAVEGDRRPSFPVERGAPFDLGELTVGLPRDRLVAHAGELLHIGVHDPHVVLGDRTDRELALQGRADLAGDDHLERETERLGDLERDDDAAARQAGDDDVRLRGTGAARWRAGVPLSARST